MEFSELHTIDVKSVARFFSDKITSRIRARSSYVMVEVGTLYAVRAYTQLLLIFVLATITSQELAPDFTGGATRSVDVGVA